MSYHQAVLKTLGYKRERQRGSYPGAGQIKGRTGATATPGAAIGREGSAAADSVKEATAPRQRQLGDR